MVDGVIACPCDATRNGEIYRRIRAARRAAGLLRPCAAARRCLAGDRRRFCDELFPYGTPRPQGMRPDRPPRRPGAYPECEGASARVQVCFGEVRVRVGRPVGDSGRRDLRRRPCGGRRVAAPDARCRRPLRVDGYGAIGAMNRLREAGLRVPAQMAVAGYSGTVLSTIVNPQLTTVEQPLDEMAAALPNWFWKRSPIRRRPTAPSR